MADAIGYHIDVVSSEESDTDTASGKLDRTTRRPWVGINFECCGVYARIYRDPAASQYVGRCPRCRSPITLRVGADGVESRLFRARPV